MPGTTTQGAERLRRGLMLIVAAPSGGRQDLAVPPAGLRHADLDLSISVTTRGPRPGEKNGREYHFIDDTHMDELIAEKAFLEYAAVHDARYGSLREPVERALSAGKNDVVRYRLAGRPAHLGQGAIGRGARLHPAAVDGRTEPPAGGARPGRR